MFKRASCLTAIIMAVSTPVMAVTYTQTGGYSNTVSKTITDTHNVTIRQGESVVKGSDVMIGGLDNTTACDPINCSSSDNITKGSSTITTLTDLKLVSTGSSTTTSTTASCFSGGSMMGLAHQESKSVESFATSGWSSVVASGTVTKTTLEQAATYNPSGLETGSVSNKVVDTTTIGETSHTTFSTTGERITFSSSVGN